VDNKDIKGTETNQAKFYLKLFPGRGFTIPQNSKLCLEARMSATALTCRFLLGYAAIRKPPAALVDAYWSFV
jgi:hypothetical protein